MTYKAAKASLNKTEILRLLRSVTNKAKALSTRGSSRYSHNWGKLDQLKKLSMVNDMSYLLKEAEDYPDYGITGRGMGTAGGVGAVAGSALGGYLGGRDFSDWRKAKEVLKNRPFSNKAKGTALSEIGTMSTLKKTVAKNRNKFLKTLGKGALIGGGLGLGGYGLYKFLGRGNKTKQSSALPYLLKEAMKFNIRKEAAKNVLKGSGKAKNVVTRTDRILSSGAKAVKSPMVNANRALSSAYPIKHSPTVKQRAKRVGKFLMAKR